MCQDWKRTIRAWLGGILFACTIYLFYTLCDNITEIVASVYPFVKLRTVGFITSIAEVSKSFVN